MARKPSAARLPGRGRVSIGKSAKKWPLIPIVGSLLVAQYFASKELEKIAERNAAEIVKKEEHDASVIKKTSALEASFHKLYSELSSAKLPDLKKRKKNVKELLAGYESLTKDEAFQHLLEMQRLDLGRIPEFKSFFEKNLRRLEDRKAKPLPRLPVDLKPEFRK